MIHPPQRLVRIILTDADATDSSSDEESYHHHNSNNSARQLTPFDNGLGYGDIDLDADVFGFDFGSEIDAPLSLPDFVSSEKYFGEDEFSEFNVDEFLVEDVL
ncbi:hypothetical protein Pint_30670 [Pistacia integerrima]|uniref:Uncharacterized protein n=1 Tax=Pistacia integerrima TaxID=434235 RepID=A0ACC0X3H5_9ROSI|nr:hypothetical protein Pint_30670 [Pistacia integerrima]